MKAANNWTLTQDSLPNFVEFVSHQFLAGRPAVKVKILPARRSLDQNALSWAIYGQVAAQLGDQTTEEVHRECKLRWGVPIMREADHTFCSMYDKSIKNSLTYEEKLEAMAFLDVTRLMNKKQFMEYMDTVIREYSKIGVVVTSPGEDQYA